MEARERFFKKVEKTEGCWLWKGALVRGYGNFGVDGKTVYAHRFSYLLHNGNLPKDKDICHSCDNKLCVNPDHLWAGTASENMKDASSKLRMSHGQDHSSAKLTECHVRTIRKLLSDSDLNQTEIAAMHNVSHSAINSIARRETWAWLV